MIYKKTLKIETPNPQRYKVEGIESAEEEEEEACSMNPKRQKTNGRLVGQVLTSAPLPIKLYLNKIYRKLIYFQSRSTS